MPSTAPAMIVIPGVDDFMAATGIQNTEAARVAYDAILSRPDGRDAIREVVGPTMTDDMLALVNRLSPDAYADAATAGISFSAWMNREAPAPQYARRDTFEHALAHLGISTVHDLERGHRASTLKDMYAAGNAVGGVTPGAVLVPELMNRAYLNGMRYGTSWIQASADERRQIERFYASSSVLSKILQPDFVRSQVMQTPLRPTILNQLVAATEQLVGTDVWNMFYVDMSDVEARRMLRAPQGATLPTVTITGGEHTGRARAYGRRILMSYEVAQWSIPLVQIHLSLFGIQASLDEEEALLSILINGDGNSGTAASVTNISDLVLVASGSTTNIPAEGILEYVNSLEESSHYTTPTIALARAIGKTLVQQAKFADSNTRLFAGATPVRPGEAENNAVAPGVPHPPIVGRSFAPSNQIVYVDGTQAAVRYIAAGAPITETDRIIRARLEEVTIWTKFGHQILMPGSVNILDYSL